MSKIPPSDKNYTHSPGPHIIFAPKYPNLPHIAPNRSPIRPSYWAYWPYWAYRAYNTNPPPNNPQPPPNQPSQKPQRAQEAHKTIKPPNHQIKPPMRQITSQPRQRRAALPPLTRDFETFLGRPLTTFEFNVIWPIERIRRRHKPQPILRPGHTRGAEPRVLVYDLPGQDSRPILLQYLAYLQHQVAPLHIQAPPPSDHVGTLGPSVRPTTDLRRRPSGLRRPSWPTIPTSAHIFPVLLAIPRRRDAQLLQRHHSLYGPTASGRYIDRVRGQNFSAALLLDAQDYGTNSPYNRRTAFSQVLRAVTPAVSHSPIPIVIIHIRCRTTRHRRNPRPIIPLLPEAYTPSTADGTAYHALLRKIQTQNYDRNRPIILLINDPPPDIGTSPTPSSDSVPIPDDAPTTTLS